MDNDFLSNYKKNNEPNTENVPSNTDKVRPTNRTVNSTGEKVNAELNSNNFNFEEKSNFEPPKNRNRAKNTEKSIPFVYIGLAVVAIIAIIVTVIMLNRGTAVPNMIGWTRSEAELWASENDVLIRAETEFSDTVEINEIFSQNPAEGESVSSGSFIELIVSSGPDLSILVEVPDIESMTMAEVESWAESNHMSKVRVTSEDSETVPEGEVISFTINDNTVLDKEIRRDSPLYVVFSRGKGEGEAVTLPDFTTMTLDATKAFAEEKKIILEIVEEFHDTYPENTIFKQNIKAEEVIREGDTVILNVSKGKEIIVPNFYEYSREKASVLASQLGIMTIVDDKYSSSNEGNLIYQSVEAGSLYTDQIIELTYSLGNSFTVPSFVGQNLDSVYAWIDPLNELGASLRISVQYTSSELSGGTILTQDKESTKIGISATINLVVSKGDVVYVPDLVQDAGSTYANIMTREKAMAICNELQLVPIFIAENSEGRLQGEVWYQSLEPGYETQQGTEIQIKYVPVNNVQTVPDFYGMTKDDIINKGYDKLFSISFTDGEYVENMEGKIVSQSVNSGSTVALGSSVILSYGSDKIEIPTTSDPSPDASNPITDGTADGSPNEATGIE